MIANWMITHGINPRACHRLSIEDVDDWLQECENEDEENEIGPEDSVSATHSQNASDAGSKVSATSSAVARTAAGTSTTSCRRAPFSHFSAAAHLARSVCICHMSYPQPMHSRPQPLSKTTFEPLQPRVTSSQTRPSRTTQQTQGPLQPHSGQRHTSDAPPAPPEPPIGNPQDTAHLRGILQKQNDITASLIRQQDK